MGYTKRFDGRKFDELREVEAKVGIIPRADGSAMFRIGKTVALAAVYGPKELYPRFMQNPQQGILRCSYNMMPFSSKGERVRPGQNRRAKEISYVTEKALRPVVDLSQFPNAVVDVFIELPQTDAGTRCAGITAAAMALADAGLTMKDLVCSVAVGNIDGTIVTDLMYDEEAYKDGPVADIPIAMIPSTGEITLLQLDGEISKDLLVKAIREAKAACLKINQIQRQALKQKYVK
ncbi:exosome complex exonuclease Rrp41 [Candidatus Woesearchaeota archaeon]|nr:MAG: exosome complex component RRP41 [archaeon GW2011_AR4]MBS3130659.1 exosome complex exonuclease Rrp41 [Candidatus Woesearchaeota archaeon]HIH37946.1 exosome complex exonuclease Rrp41 [Candidatus Woesearchaeota archaeon]HIH48639.1 exosome complex exonuclease Rrp41 [Candidatus Woesearchaeota archaeon]HIJ03725.1 exosome complex exonuclease Rrp41 [Candidatus Woesearchaeota archaeon]